MSSNLKFAVRLCIKDGVKLDENADVSIDVERRNYQDRWGSDIYPSLSGIKLESLFFGVVFLCTILSFVR